MRSIGKSVTGSLGQYGPFWLLLTSARELVPHSAHLFLHSGAIGADDDPQSNVRPKGRARDNRTITGKAEVKKRAFESFVEKGVQEETAEAGTPRKKVSLPFPPLSGPF